MEFGLIDRLVWSITMALSAAIIVRLGSLRLLFAQPYQAFSWMLAANLLREAVLWPLSYDVAVYAQAWEASLVIMWFVQIAAAISTYDQIARRHTREFTAAISVALALAVLPLIFETPHLGGSADDGLRLGLLVYRWIDGGLAVLLISAALTSTRKAPAHLWMLAGYFAEYFLVCLVKNLLPLQVPILNRAHLLAVAVLYAIWLILLPGARQNSARVLVASLKGEAIQSTP